MKCSICTAHAAFCKSTAVAHYYARAFRAITRIQLGFLDCHLYSPVGTGEDGYHFCGEKWLKGHFVKLNSNAGFVNEADYSEHSTIAQAFSHFTFDQSNGELLVVDLQGICGGDETNPYFLLTDPQVHSRGAFERFGNGDLGEPGITAFFQKHRCGEWCQRLHLRKEHELRAATHIVRMPGVPDCIAYLLSDCRALFSQMTSGKGVSFVSVPREANNDWLEVRMWATERAGARATEILKKKVEGFYDKTRLLVTVEPVPQWDVCRGTPSCRLGGKRLEPYWFPFHLIGKKQGL